MRRQEKGFETNIFRELRDEDPQRFRALLRMDHDTFMELLGLIELKIKRVDTAMRDAITPCARLSVTLDFLATGRNVNTSLVIWHDFVGCRMHFAMFYRV